MSSDEDDAHLYQMHSPTMDYMKLVGTPKEYKLVIGQP